MLQTGAVVKCSIPAAWMSKIMGDVSAALWDASAGDRQYTREFRSQVMSRRLGSIFTGELVLTRLKLFGGLPPSASSSSSSSSSAAAAAAAAAPADDTVMGPPTVLMLPDSAWDPSCDTFW